MKLVALTQGYSAKVDDADYEWASSYPWHVEFMSGKPYATYRLRGRRIWMHRALAGTQDGRVTDHRDGDPLNNQRGNLRPATHAQNAANAGKRSATRPFKGVSRNGPGWAANCSHEGRNHYLGTYDAPEKAAVAYDLFAYMAHGDFARLNGV